MKTAAVSALFLASLTFVPGLQAGPVTTLRGDLILGFKADNNPGLDTNLEVNLGPASAFYGAAAGSASVLTRLSVQDLKDVYGDDWATRSDLSWGVVGTTGSSAVGTAIRRTVWATRAESTAGAASTPWQTAGFFALQIPSNVIVSLYSASPGSLGNPSASATANSIYSAKIFTSLSGSWSEREGSLAGVSFQYFNPGVMKAVNTFPAAGSAYDGTAYTVLDLYQLTPTEDDSVGPATLLGGIGLNAAGKLVFSTDITKFAAPSTTVELGQPTLTLSGNSATVVLASAPAGNYVLERSTTLVNGSWFPVETKTAVSGTLTFSDAAVPAGRSFYRIKKTS